MIESTQIIKDDEFMTGYYGSPFAYKETLPSIFNRPVIIKKRMRMCSHVSTLVSIKTYRSDLKGE